MPNPNIIIGYSTTATTLTARPNDYSNSGAATIIWGKADPVASIEEIVITKKNDGSYPAGGSQPSATGQSGRWSWNDPGERGNQYEYVVSAKVTGVGVVTLDPKIINT